MKIIDKSITEIINTDYLEYAMYVLQNRAIPSAIDGFKPVHRKLVYCMLNVHGGKKTKVADLGSISSLNYHHGEASAMSAVTTLTADWNNNCPVFTGHGNFGSRLVQEASAPRYIYASLSPEFKKYFIDTDICPVSLDPDNPEPAHYLPTIPWVLVNGISGIAVGFATSILSRSIDTLSGEVKRCLKDPKRYLKDNRDVPPTFPHFKGTVTKGETNQWFTFGIVTYSGKNVYTITELPVGHDRESYINLLHGLIDSDKIRDFEDNCSEAGFGFTIKVSAQQKLAIDSDPIKYFKLSKPSTENLTTLGIDGKLKIFQTVSELIAYFVEYRLSKFGEKIEFQKTNLLLDIQELRDRVKFILSVVNRKVDFRVLSREDLLNFIHTNITRSDWGKTFINIPLYNCTMDSVKSLQDKISQLESDHRELLKETSLSRYLKVLT
jgi:DNA gyrase/topoisomerase IV subunit A